MQKPEEIKMPSGAILKVQVAPFADAKDLYQALLRDLKHIEVSTKVEIASLYRDLFCHGFSSQGIESTLWTCFARCTLDGSKIDKDTFEPVERRGDYVQVCIEVAKANVFPFVKSLYAEYQKYSATLEDAPV